MTWDMRYPSKCVECAFLHIEATKETGFIPKPKGCFYAFNKFFDLKEFDPYKERPEWCPFNGN